MQSASMDEIMAKVPAEFYSHDPDSYRTALAGQIPIFSANGLLTLPAIERTLQSMFDEGTLKRDEKIVLAETYDNTFAEVANKQ